MNLNQQIEALAADARDASRELASAETTRKNAWLECAVAQLIAVREEILEANRRDIEAAQAKGVSAVLLNRLRLESKWDAMLDGLKQVAALPDPVGEVSELRLRPNGLRVGRMRIPLGVIAIIYESRPNVTVDAAALCLKAGNAVILRGGSEAFHSNQALGRALQTAATKTGLPAGAIAVAPSRARSAVDQLLALDRYIDLVIPRGGNALVRKVREQSTIPVIAHDAGVCHIYLDATADPKLATGIVLESKLRQMAVCNALETLLCHEAIAESVLPTVLGALHEQDVEVRGCARTCAVFAKAKPASEADWGEEYLDKIVAVRVVADLDEAIAHIQRYGSDHTDIIVTNDYGSGQAWLRRLNSATVGINCSTGFADGYQLGLGAEIGISTSKLHSFGPMGLEELTTRKFVLYGDGQLVG